eukprot:snap_masked-scaffold_16-processed-gene-6.94-mRNA-1 protein AED:1.00 eAED:1.00 QI:0/0/0/0/1/1/4/0/75
MIRCYYLQKSEKSPKNKLLRRIGIVTNEGFIWDSYGSPINPVKSTLKFGSDNLLSISIKYYHLSILLNVRFSVFQ